MTERESSRHERGNGELKGNQRGRVVHQTFAFQNGLNAMRHGKPADHTRRGDRVWRGNDCSKRERGCPRQTRRDRMRRASDRDRGEKDQSDREQQNWSQIAPEIPPRGEQRRRINERGQKEKENKVRIEPHLWKMRNETQGKSSKNEHNRIGQRELARDYCQSRYRCE